MTPSEFRAALARLSLSQSAFARLLQALARSSASQLRSVQRWADETRTEPVPEPVAALLHVMERQPQAWRDAA